MYRYKCFTTFISPYYYWNIHYFYSFYFHSASAFSSAANIERHFSSVQYLIHIAIDKKNVLENRAQCKLEKALYAVDELTGLIGAVVLMLVTLKPFRP